MLPGSGVGFVKLIETSENRIAGLPSAVLESHPCDRFTPSLTVPPLKPDCSANTLARNSAGTAIKAEPDTVPCQLSDKLVDPPDTVKRVAPSRVKERS
jgi:hypothetical protein